MVLRSNVVVDTVALSEYVARLAAVDVAAVSAIRGAAANALLNVTVASLPPVAQPVPVVTVIVPAVSVPATLTVGVVHAAVPAAIVGTVPLVTIWPDSVSVPVTSNFAMTIFIFVVSAVNKLVPLAFWTVSAVVLLAWRKSTFAPSAALA